MHIFWRIGITLYSLTLCFLCRRYTPHFRLIALHHIRVVDQASDKFLIVLQTATLTETFAVDNIRRFNLIWLNGNFRLRFPFSSNCVWLLFLFPNKNQTIFLWVCYDCKNFFSNEVPINFTQERNKITIHVD